jgi:hypothetical protein
MFRTAKSPSREIEYYEPLLAHSPKSVTNTFDEFTKDDALVSAVVLMTLSAVNVVGVELICSVDLIILSDNTVLSETHF